MMDTQKLAELFCAWPLPETVCSDLCATKQGYPDRSGTNLLSVAEAKQFFDFLVMNEHIATPAPPSLAVGEDEPPCGEQCPKDEDCDNYGIDGETCPHAPKDKPRVIWMGENDIRLMVDPSVPAEMILFPDEATRKWFVNRNERLIDALKCIRKHIQKMQDKNPGYDFNADPLSTTLIEGWINTALDTEEFCPDWMCQHECPARESLKEHLEQAAQSPQGCGWQDISTAPRDGTPILIAVPPDTGGPCIYVAWNREGRWAVFDSGRGHRAYTDATHWQPLPAPPANLLTVKGE